MPGKHRISGEQAMLFLGSIRERLAIIALSADEYADASKLRLPSGLSARHLRCHAGAVRFQSQSGSDLYVECASLSPMRT